MAGERTQVVLLPGGIMPASLAYAPLLEVLGDEVDAVAKGLELYAGDAPPSDYTVEVELDGVLRAAERAGFERFHLVGYSGGGAVALAFAARHRGLLQSLAVVEPAWDGNNGLSPEEERLWKRIEALLQAGRSDQELMGEFMRLQLAPGVDPPQPPPGPPPEWMAKRPAGIRSLIAAFREGGIDPAERLRAFDRPVHFALGSLSNPDYWQRMRERLDRTFTDFTAEVYDGRHHFDPPHRAEPERFAAALRALWVRANAVPA